MRSETLRLQHEQSVMKEKIRENGEKIKQNKVLPYLVGNVVEVSVSATVAMSSREESYMSCVRDMRNRADSCWQLLS